MFPQASMLLTLASLVVSQTTPAPMISNNQYGCAYSVALVQGPGPLAGTFDFKASAKGVHIAFNMNGFNISDETTYTYHIHEKPVPQNGSCNATGEHFDPYRVGAAHKCDPNESDLCQLGDLSGKHGPIVVNSSNPVFTTEYSDNFISTNEGDLAFFGNLSIVVHRKRDSFRLNCGNFSLYGYPILVNGSIASPGNASSPLGSEDGNTVRTSASPFFGIISNATSMVATTDTSTLLKSPSYTVSTDSKTSSSMSLQTVNHGSGRVEVSLMTLGMIAIVPVLFL